jgi:hypothetical protein
MAVKRPSRSTQSAGQRPRKPKKPKKPPEGWIRIVWGQVVRSKLGRDGGNIRLRLKRRPGEARTIALTYALTKKALAK